VNTITIPNLLNIMIAMLKYSKMTVCHTNVTEFLLLVYVFHKRPILRSKNKMIKE
jgi:hypothetical protein